MTRAVVSLNGDIDSLGVVHPYEKAKELARKWAAAGNVAQVYVLKEAEFFDAYFQLKAPQ